MHTPIKIWKFYFTTSRFQRFTSARLQQNCATFILWLSHLPVPQWQSWAVWEALNRGSGWSSPNLLPRPAFWDSGFGEWLCGRVGRSYIGRWNQPHNAIKLAFYQSPFYRWDHQRSGEGESLRKRNDANSELGMQTSWSSDHKATISLGFLAARVSEEKMFYPLALSEVEKSFLQKCNYFWYWNHKVSQGFSSYNIHESH